MVLPVHHHRYVSLRKHLKAMRLGAKLTQAQLAKKLKLVDQSYVSKIERGERYVDMLFYLDWCRACGVSAQQAVSEFDNH